MTSPPRRHPSPLSHLSAFLLRVHSVSSPRQIPKHPQKSKLLLLFCSRFACKNLFLRKTNRLPIGPLAPGLRSFCHSACYVSGVGSGLGPSSWSSTSSLDGRHMERWPPHRGAVCCPSPLKAKLLRGLDLELAHHEEDELVHMLVFGGLEVEIYEF